MWRMGLVPATQAPKNEEGLLSLMGSYNGDLSQILFGITQKVRQKLPTSLAQRVKIG